MQITESDTTISGFHRQPEPEVEIGEGAPPPADRQEPIISTEEAEAEVRLSLLQDLIAEPAGPIYRPAPGRPLSGPVGDDGRRAH